MRRYLMVLLGVVLLFAIAAVAQANSGSSGQSSTSTNSAQKGSSTVEGCIVREEQDYYIYPTSGQPQHISSTGQDVSGHVGHHVKLQGTSAPAASSSSSTSGGTGSANATSGGQDFSVAEVDMVSESCPDSIKQKAAAAGMSTSPK